jgi:hypothetical protein
LGVTGKQYLKEPFSAVLYLMPPDYPDGGDDPTQGKAAGWPARLIATTKTAKLYLWPGAQAEDWKTMQEDLLRALVENRENEDPANTSPPLSLATNRASSAAALTVAADEAAILTNYAAKIRELLPPRWEVNSLTTNAVPYNLGIKPGQRRGTRLTVVGPTMVKGPREINDERESFQIWIMPADYRPTTPDTIAPFEEAKLLGSNEAVAAYGTSFTTSTPSWKTWKEDLAKHLRLTKDKGAKGSSP